MRNFLFYGLVIFLMSSCGNGDRLFPKKHLGIYEGKQEAYEVSMNGNPILVPESDLELSLDYGSLWVKTPNQNLAATYEVKAKTKLYYSLIVVFESGIIEEWQLWKKGNKLIRKSIPPVPEVILLK